MGYKCIKLDKSAGNLVLRVKHNLVWFIHQEYIVRSSRKNAWKS